MENKYIKRIALITDISGLGNCSGTTNTAILSSMGIECCVVPTAILSAQTGFPDYYIYDFTDCMKEYINSLEKISPKFDAIYIGFIANAEQAEIIKRFVRKFRLEDTVIITDPIIGDNGKRHSFFNDLLFKKISNLISDSDLITPNLTELCLLTDSNYNNINSLDELEKYKSINELCQKLMKKSNINTVVVTGIDSSTGYISNLIAQKSGYEIVSNKKSGGSYSGTGDIFTSIVCGNILNSLTVINSVKQAADFVSRILQEEHNNLTNRNYGIPYQLYLNNNIN